VEEPLPLDAPVAEPFATGPDPYAALRLPDYRRFALGWTIATTGLRMQAVAVMWEIYTRTHSPMALGYVGLSQALPVVALALLGGHTADVHDRKRIVLVTQLAFLLCSTALALLSFFGSPVWTIYLCLTAASAARAFNSPARASLLPQIVPAGIFQNAVAWNSSFFQISAIGGPILAGAMLSWAGAAWPVCAIAAMGALTFAATITGVAPHPVPAAAEPRSLRTMLAGLSFLRQEKTVLAAITLDLFAVLLGGATSLLPVFAKDILKSEPLIGSEAVRLGLLNAAPFIGALLTAQVLARRGPLRHAGPTFLLSVAGFGVATIAFGLSTNFRFSFILLVILGGLDGISVVIRHVLVQMRTPDAVRGRVSAVNSVFIESSNELGGFESGLVADLFGAVTSVIAGGVGTILVVIGIAALWPPIRRLRRIVPEVSQPG
jgi:MFS family permease